MKKRLELSSTGLCEHLADVAVRATRALKSTVLKDPLPLHAEAKAVSKTLNDKQCDAFSKLLASSAHKDHTQQILRSLSKTRTKSVLDGWEKVPTLLSETAEQYFGRKSKAQGTPIASQAMAGSRSFNMREAETASSTWKDASQGHKDKQKALINIVAAGLINYCIMFGFCCAYSVIIFSDAALVRHRALGININVGTAVIMGFLLSANSKIPVAIGGPDMNPTLFIAAMVENITKSLQDDFNRNLAHSGGRRMAPSDSGFCVGTHYDANPSRCETYHQEFRATLICTVSICSFLQGCVFMALGRLRLTRYIAYVPTSIIEALLTCQGYKVFKFGLQVCKFKPNIFVPAAGVGVPLYFLKANHVGEPAIVIPVCLALPLIGFYLVILISGSSLESARDDYMFETIENEAFYNVWGEGAMKWKDINVKALLKNRSELVVMLIVCTLDCMVTALRTTETKMPLKVDKHFETQLYGIGNIVTTVFGCTPGYMQLNLNAVNYGVMGTCRDRRGGVIYAILCVTAYFGPVSQINFIPRVFLGTLMFFCASGFVAEHLWGSRDYLSFAEWLQVFIILGVFIWFDILWAVLIGAVLCGIGFIIKYAKIPCIAGHPMRGGELESCERHPPLVAICLHHLVNSWLVVIRLKGYIFFASVQKVTNYIRDMLAKEEADEIPKYQRVRYILLDCELLDGLDSSAEKDLQQLSKEVRNQGVRVMWDNLPDQLVHAMVSRGTIACREDAFSDLDSGLLYVQSVALAYRRRQQVMWSRLHPAFELNHILARLRDSYEPFGDVLRLDIERFGCPWEFTSKLTIQKYKTLLWTPGEWNRELFLVHTGAIGLFRKIPSKDGKVVAERPLAVYRHGWFLNRQATMRLPTRLYALALEDGEVAYWTNHDWCRMNREQPLMAAAILESAMRQASADMERMIRLVRNADSATHDEQPVQQKPFWQDSPLPKRGLSILLPGGLEDDQFIQTEDLDARLEGIIAAQHLETFGLYERLRTGEVGFLPDLPRLVRHDLELAFQTYCIEDAFGDGIPWDSVNRALMYAGIFNTLLVDEHRTHIPLSRDQFFRIGHEAYFMRLSSKQLVKLFNHIGKEILKEGMLPRDQIYSTLKRQILPQISEQEVNGVANTWEDDSSGMISAAEFFGIVSRFVRRHEQDWNVLRAIRDLLVKTRVDEEFTPQELTPEKMVLWAQRDGMTKLTLTEAEEMLWSASCHSMHSKAGKDALDGKSLDWTGIAGAAMVNIDQPKGKLPPRPKRDGTHGVARTLRQSIKIHMSQPPTPNAAGELRRSTQLCAESQDIHHESTVVHELMHDHIAEHRRWLNPKWLEEPPWPEQFASASIQPTESKSTSPLASAKLKVCRAAKTLCTSAARQAADMVGLESNITNCTHFVQDLRSKPCSMMPPSMFHHTRLSNVDFKSLRKSKTRVKLEVEYNPSSKIPDTADAKIHMLLDFPESSAAAYAWSIFMGFCIIGSVATLFLKSIIHPDEDKMSSSAQISWKFFECSFTIIFMGEIMVRFAVAEALGNQTYFDFLTKPLNICDIIAVFPFIVEMALESQQTRKGGTLNVASLLKVTRLMRLARVARLARLANSKRSALFGPVAAVFTVVWGIYLRETQ